MNTLKGSVCVITGGNSGIGLATATLFSNEGAKVVICGRNKKSIDSAMHRLDGESLALVADVQNQDDIGNLFYQTKAKFGNIDTLVINAGCLKITPTKDVSEHEFDEQVNTNFKGAFFTLQNALPLLKDGSSVIFISSIARIKAPSGTAVYAATKAALRALTQTLSLELADRNIRVNSISPGFIDTPIVNRMGLEENILDDILNGLEKTIPLGRRGQAKEVAEIVKFLASSSSSYITGEDIIIDGGQSKT